MTNPVIDPSDMWLPDPPREWEAIPPEILERLAPQLVSEVPIPGPYGTARTGRKARVYNQGVMLTPEQKKELDRLASGRWFLLRNDGPHLSRCACGRCGGTHAYFTLACVERPFHGLQEIVGLMDQVIGQDRVFDAIRVGSIEPITRAKAKQLADRIRAKGESLAPQKGAWDAQVRRQRLWSVAVRP